MAMACAEKFSERSKATLITHSQWYCAWRGAMDEFESCCYDRETGVPHWSTLLCEGCSKVVCNCLCSIECKCGRRVPKWGWVVPVAAPHTTFCRCVKPKPRGAEWHNLLPWWPKMGMSGDESDDDGDCDGHHGGAGGAGAGVVGAS